MSELFDPEIAAGVRAGDPDAVGEVYVILSDRLLGYLIARVRDRATAEDLLEATFIELLRKGHTITGGPAAIKVWLFRSAYFNALDHIRKVKRRSEDFTEDFSGVDIEDAADGPEDISLRREKVQTVRAAMQHLSPDQRAVLEMRYVAGLSAPEVADVLNKTEGAVRSLQHRGERSLHRMLTSVDNPEISDQAVPPKPPTTS